MAALGQTGAHRVHVFGAPDERETHEVGLDLDGHLQRDRVGVGERIDVAFGARHVHALAGPQQPFAHNTALDVVAVDLLDAQHDRAVGEEHLVADAHPACELGNRGGYAVLVTLDRLLRRGSTRLSTRSSTSSPITGPVRSFGPGRSTSTPTVLSSAAAAARATAARSACTSGVPCAALSRTTSTPAWSSALSASGSDVAGPIVATILVLRIPLPLAPCLSAQCAPTGACQGAGRRIDTQAQIRRPGWSSLVGTRWRAGGRSRIDTASVEYMDRILVSGLREMGVHGVLAEEQERPQPFRVDLELLVDLGPAGASDALADTVDYGSLSEAVRAIVASEHHQLLERLAARIAEVCRADPRVQGVVVEVRKLEPPVPGDLDYVGVRIER